MAWVNNLSFQTLGKIAGAGGLILIGTNGYLKNRLRENLKSTPMYQSALNILKGHPGAVLLLGEPIREGRININYDENYCDGQNAKYKIPVSGPKNSAFYYFWAERNENDFIVTKSELELKNDNTKRLVILKQKEPDVKMENEKTSSPVTVK